MIYLGSDHAGFEAKEKLKKYLEIKKIEYEDLGALRYNGGDDYPDYAFKVAKAVSRHKRSKGILICGTGAGLAIAANKVHGIRAAEAFDAYTAKMSREHNDANILALGARDLPIVKIIKIVDIWLNTPFSNEERHDGRIRKIMHFENSHHI